MKNNDFYLAIRDNITREKIKNMYRAIGVYIIFAITSYAFPLSLVLTEAEVDVIKAAYVFWYIGLYGAGIHCAGVIISTFLGDNKADIQSQASPTGIETITSMSVEDRLVMLIQAGQSIRELVDKTITDGIAAKEALAPAAILPPVPEVPPPPKE